MMNARREPDNDTGTHDEARAFHLRICPASDRDREFIETKHGDLGSDACVCVWIYPHSGDFVGSRLIGWGDDYGTFHPIEAPTSAGKLEAAGEVLLSAAQDFWEVEDR